MSSVLKIPEWGQRVAAAIVPGPGITLEENQLIADLRSRLAGYKIPRQFIFLERLPQTESGKILRQQVLAQLTAETVPQQVTLNGIDDRLC